MKKDDLVRKLTSRKFIVSLITVIAGIVTLIIGENAIVQIIAGAAMTIIPTIVYCIMEGKIDSASVKTVTETAIDAAEKLGADSKTVEIIEQAGEFAETIIDDE